MTNGPDRCADSPRPSVYQIRLKGHLGRQWSEWFDSMTIVLEENGETVLTGPVTDQAALYGLLRKVRDLGMTLLSVTRMDLGSTGGPDAVANLD